MTSCISMKMRLRQGRSVVIAFVEADEDRRSCSQSILASAGAESIDAARESWWVVVARC